MARRLTAKGYKIRKTRQLNQIKKELSDLNLFGKDYKELSNFLNQGLTTKRGVARSKRLLGLLKDKDFKKLSRFKQIKDLKNIKGATYASITSLLRDTAEFYVENYELIREYNALSKKQKKNKKNKTRIKLERKVAEWKKQNQQIK